MALNLNIVSKFNPKGIQEAQGAFGNLGSSLKKFAGLAVAAFATIGGAQFLKDSIKQASDLGESINAVNKAYGDYAKDVLALGDDVASRLGLSTVDFNAAAVRFSAFAERIAGEGGNVAGVVDGLTERAADFASVYNIEVSEALRVFQSGLSGEAEPLKRFGINLLDSEVKAYAYANGIANVGAQLTETQKVQARYGLLLESTAKTQGDFADTSDGLANSQRILQANMKNLQAQVGEGLTPVLASFTSALVPLAQIIFPALANFLNTYIAPGLQKAADAFKAFTTEAEKSGEGIGGIFDALSNLFKNFLEGDGLSSFFERLAQMRMNFFNAITTALPGIIDAFVAFLPKIISFLVDDLLPAMINELSGIITQLADLLVVALPKLVEALLRAVPMLLDGATKLFETLVNALVIIVPKLITALIDILPKLVKTLKDMLPKILDSAIQLFTALVEAIPVIVPMLIQAILDLLPEIIKTLVDMLPALVEGAVKLFMGIAQGVIKALPEIIRATMGLVPEIVNALLKSIPQLVRAGFELLAGLAKGIIDNTPKVLGEAVNSVGKFLVNGVKDFLGIRSPSKVFYDIGDDVTTGLATGIRDTSGQVASAAESLVNIANDAGSRITKAFDKSITTISSIPGIASTVVEEQVRITADQVRRMAEEVEGLFAQFDKKGNLLSSYTGYGVPTLVPDVTGQLFDVGRATDDLNAIYKYAGAKTIADMERIQKDLFGGSFQQALDTLTGQTTLIDPKTGMSTTIGGTPEGVAAAVERALAQGLQVVAPVGKSVDELKDVLNSLADQVSAKGLRPFELAKGGFVNTATLAVVGEAGPEVVMPLDQFMSTLGQGGGGSTYQININAGIGSDPVSIGRYVTDAIKRYESVSGKVFANA
jgi:phage-related protein